MHIDAPSPRCAGQDASTFRALSSNSGDDAFDEAAWRTYLDRVGFQLG